MAKNNNFGGNLIWRMAKNDNFGGNLIWRMAKNVNFCGKLVWRILAEFLTNSPNPLKFLPAKTSSLKVAHTLILTICRKKFEIKFLMLFGVKHHVAGIYHLLLCMINNM